jgi:hypothetical protein
MPNQFLNVSWLAMEVLRLLVNKLTVAEYFNTEFDKEFHKEFAVGSSIQVKFPQKYTVRNGLGYAPQGINRIATSINLDQPFGIDWEWDDYEKAVKAERSEEEIREQYLEPAAAQLGQEIDQRCAQFAYQNTSTVAPSGVLGTDPTSVATYYGARRRLQEKAAQPGKRCMLISSSMMATFGANITTFFNPGDELSRIFKEGYLGRAAGFDWIESNSLYSHTAGTWAGAVTVNGAGQSGTSLIITATANDTFNQGDKFAVANVNSVNPMTRRAAGPLVAQHFTVTVPLVAAGGGVDVLNFLPAIFGPGSQYQNVDALPANTAALTLWPGTSSPNGKVGTVGLAMVKRGGFALVGAKLYTPKSVEVAQQKQDTQTGLAVRYVRAWDPVRSMNINRWDSVIGMGSLYQDNNVVAVPGA